MNPKRPRSVDVESEKENPTKRRKGAKEEGSEGEEMEIDISQVTHPPSKVTPKLQNQTGIWFFLFNS